VRFNNFAVQRRANTAVVYQGTAASSPQWDSRSRFATTPFEDGLARIVE